MKKGYLRRHGKSAIDILDQGYHLLRQAGSPALAAYLCGVAPFLTAVLFFWADMSRSAFASDHLLEASLGLAVLFIWMRVCQNVFTRILLARLFDRPPELHWRSLALSTVIQTTFHATGFIILPLAALLTLPFGWVYAFYQNVTALDDGSRSLKEVFRGSRRQSALWPAQNHLLLLFLALFGLYVFINIFSVCAYAPSLVKMLFGIDTVFSQSIHGLTNTTFLATICALTYLCVDPLVKTCYILRCFEGESLHSGNDLRVGLRRLSTIAAAVLLILIAVPAHAADPAPAVPQESISPQSLDTAIGQTVDSRKYAWRMPREKVVDEKPKGFLSQLFEKIFDALKNFFKTIGELFKKLMEFIFGDRNLSSPNTDKGAAKTAKALLILVLVLVVLTLAFVLAKLLLRKKKTAASGESAPIQAIPDLEDEDVAADQLPEDQWTALARDLIAKGELRLGLRALYLASLSHLAESRLIVIARSKSNREYERELKRRSHTRPGLLDLFSENIGIFDRVWYGTHAVDSGMVDRFAQNVERIRENS
jgi:hypothetical protein